MKELLILMNCLGEEIIHYLSRVPEITQNFSLKLISTYTNLDNPGILTDVRTCDILIMNNIKSYEHMTYERIKKEVKPTCKICRIEFIRFNGYYPTLPYTFHSNSLAVYDNSTESASFDDYTNYFIAPDTIVSNFNESLVKLRELDELSDIKFYDFFVSHHKEHALFRDNHHLTAFFIKYIVKQVLLYFDMETSVNIDALPLEYSFGHKFRVKPVLDCVKRALGLTFDTSIVNIFNKDITLEKYYTYIQEVKSYTSLESCVRHFMEIP